MKEEMSHEEKVLRDLRDCLARDGYDVQRYSAPNVLLLWYGAGEFEIRLLRRVLTEDTATHPVVLAVKAGKAVL